MERFVFAVKKYEKEEEKNKTQSNKLRSEITGALPLSSHSWINFEKN